MIDYEVHDSDPESNYEPSQEENSGALLPAVVRRESIHTTSYAVTRPDPFFVTQLIATATQVPQTRTLRRTTPEDAQTSYQSVVDQNKPHPASRPVKTSRVA